MSTSPLQIGAKGSDDLRARQARHWAQTALGHPFERFAPASADASFRRYFRGEARERSWIVMDAPPQHEDCEPFVRIAGLLDAAGLNVPAVLAQDLDHGFLLLSDLGTRTLLDVLDEENADALMGAAIDALIRWQRASRPDVLPEYDDVLLRRELALFPDWYLQRHLGLTLSGLQHEAWNGVVESLIAAALAQPRVFVHRDYMPRNLMLSEPMPGVLDFQDAVHGPIAYDVISLFKDAFHSWPATRVDAWIARYWRDAKLAGLPLGDEAAFRRDCDWIGVQRHLKILGIFARLSLRDGKPKYLADTPRFVRYVVDVAARYPEFAALSELFERQILPRPA
ncbi:phosphotransferase [Algiphilus sp. W345]|uniref:Phosphotransferase n=1 Tax=Banduia mediterranea TaxID=3075609 RepID=A0ABU2WFX8_9GAMM|nr:phosphotransferase [Algiphilus sp. W345]MDT0496775.1 phosphotransferase [Algiphilus sp. W345]